MTTYETPISVSGRVVKTVTASSTPATPSSAKSMFAPSERPIHAFCIVTVPSGHASASSASPSCNKPPAGGGARTHTSAPSKRGRGSASAASGCAPSPLTSSAHPLPQRPPSPPLPTAYPQ
eukprot:5824302-Prymnesium_polylepis.1